MELKLTDIRPNELDAILSKFPELKSSMKIKPAPVSTTEEQDIGLLFLTIKLIGESIGLGIVILKFIKEYRELKNTTHANNKHI